MRLRRSRANWAPARDLPDQQILQMLAATRIGREQKQCCALGHHERYVDDCFLNRRPAAVGPGEGLTRLQFRPQCASLRLPPQGFESCPIGNDDAESRNLRDREIDEHDAPLEHLDAERDVRQCNDNTGCQCGLEDAPPGGPLAHRKTASSRFSVPSERPKRFFAGSLRPTVKGTTTAGIMARCDSHSEARG